jgi:hypothetical protein
MRSMPSMASARSHPIRLREAALALGVSPADFDAIVDPKMMFGNPRRDLGLE